MPCRVELIGGPADGQVIESDWDWPQFARWDVPVQDRAESCADMLADGPIPSNCSTVRIHRYGPGLMRRGGRYYLLSEHIHRA